MKILKNKKALLLFVAIGCIILIWYGWREYNYRRMISSLANSFAVSEEQLQNAGQSDSTLNSPDDVEQGAWYGWELGDPLPE